MQLVAVAAVGRLVGKDAGFAGLESDDDAPPVGGNGQRADALVEGADGLGLGAGRGRGEDVQDAIFPTEEGHLLLLLLLLIRLRLRLVGGRGARGSGGRGRGKCAEGVGPLAGSREGMLRGGQRGYRRHGPVACAWYWDDTVCGGTRAMCENERFLN